ncbi:hypothetical protein QJS04_geneDACA017539 [Acorus gramineus]|uniref:PORR domain-containing protein n=1 Tax=Acorus gramineus TaxID=55184 RepID=A0AAV9BRP5_ACOGR|nr:hypothetical protein QJS04_geneDACA017539 [Acorus gramineus]
MYRRLRPITTISITWKLSTSPPPPPLPTLLSIQTTPKSTTTGGKNKKPKKKFYYRVPSLDHAMDLQKKPSLILLLKNLITTSNKTHSIHLRDLEKEVGFIQKWNLMSIIERYSTIFRVTGGSRFSPIAVTLTEKAARIAAEEAQVRELMEPIVVKKLRKLLMMSLDCQVSLETIKSIESEMGLPGNFRESIIEKYPRFFSVVVIRGRDHLRLESWDSSLAVTAREKGSNLGGFEEGNWIAKDENYDCPSAFRLNFPPGFRANVGYLEEVKKWQKLEFPSPYLNGRRVNHATPQARKRMVAVLHELLSLTMERRMSTAQLDALRAEYRLPGKLLLCLVKHHGIFYLTNKGGRSTVFLKEAYQGSHLIDKCPLLRFNDKFLALSGRVCDDFGNVMPSEPLC